MKLIRRCITMILVLAMVGSINVSVLAKENDELNKDEGKLRNNDSNVSVLFSNFIKTCFEDSKGMCVLDVNGENVTEEFINDSLKYYKTNKYKSIQEIIENNGLQVSYQDSEPQGEVTTRALRTETVKKSFYTIRKETTLNTYTKEWLTTITGTFTYDANTHRVTSSGSPTLKLVTANFGAAFSPKINNISTKYSISGTKVTFSASYNMKATLGISIGSFPAGYDLNFGNCYETFTATPSNY